MISITKVAERDAADADPTASVHVNSTRARRTTYDEDLLLAPGTPAETGPLGG
ncbi:hypothetical protein [Actinopolymorpha pittospori]|uniref:Uncharacterized protein n=1 Tax=Actinopolymorpha pittospori TaxID=648752 RepID=A0A927N423_9ACTN|nr:hypothetical protein [Actinopolymorpha pittospori]MBE1609913.1 hypothetical protein [Actinopolymorpha pittospori]